MKIQQLKDMPNGYKIGGGFPMAVKTIKKSWQVNKEWYQQIVLMDDTGEMLADVKLGKTRNSLRGIVKDEIKVIVAMIQDSEYMSKSCKKLYIDQWDYPVCIGEPPMSDEMKDYLESHEQEVRSKIRCWLVANMRQSRGFDHKLLQSEKDICNNDVDYIMTGE